MKSRAAFAAKQFNNKKWTESEVKWSVGVVECGMWGHVCQKCVTDRLTN